MLEAAVQFVGSLQSKKPAPTVTGDVAHGRQLYAELRRAAMARRAKATQTLQAPALAARSDWYLVTQLRNFRTACAARMNATR